MDGMQQPCSELYCDLAGALVVLMGIVLVGVGCGGGRHRGGEGCGGVCCRAVTEREARAFEVGRDVGAGWCRRGGREAILPPTCACSGDHSSVAVLVGGCALPFLFWMSAPLYFSLTWAFQTVFIVDGVPRAALPSFFAFYVYLRACG